MRETWGLPNGKAKPKFDKLLLFTAILLADALPCFALVQSFANRLIIISFFKDDQIIGRDELCFSTPLLNVTNDAKGDDNLIHRILSIFDNCFSNCHKNQFVIEKA